MGLGSLAPDYEMVDRAADSVHVSLATEVDSDGSLISSAAFGALGIAAPSDIGLTDPPPGSGPPTSASSSVNVANNIDGSVTSTGSAGNDYIYSSNGPQQIALLDGFDLASTGDANDSIDLGGGDDYAESFGGADTILGGDGDDTLVSGDGDDFLVGGAGADAINGGADFDTADYAGATAGVTINLSLGTGLGAEAEGDTLTNIERVIGSAFNDTLIGSAANETLVGGGKTDYLEGGAGADVLDGGLAIDYAVYTGASAGVALSLATGGTGGDAAGDIFISIERVIGSKFNDTISGSAGDEYFLGDGGNDAIDGLGGNDFLNGQAGADTLNGGDGSDTVIGGNGNDRIAGGAGNDALTGGSGDDVFIFARGDGIDTIMDFKPGASIGDLLQLSGFGEAFDSFSEILGASTDNGVDTTIDFGGGDLLILKNVLVSQLSPNDIQVANPDMFGFVPS